jgi:membrane protease YdiL (CAAX protease family)
MRDIDQGVAAPALAAARHFVFSPGGSAGRNRISFYFASLGLFIILAYALQYVAGSIVVGLSANNMALRGILRAMLHGGPVPWDWYFGLAAITFGTFLIAMAVALRAVHARGFLSVLTDRSRFDWGRAGRGFLLYSVLLAGPFAYVLIAQPGALKLHFDAGPFIELFVVAAGVLVIQTSAEEMFFRGYLSQFMGSFTNSTFVIIGVPSLLFAAAHLGNPEIAADPGVFTFYFGFGLFMALIAVRDRGLELTIGAHLANNFITAVLVRTPESVFQTPSLFLLPAQNSPDQVAIFGPTFAPVLYFLITALLMRRR